ncbi:Mucin-associated surface protein (MASP) [Trypanosoma cruzi]|uniref:Mucin-associated surface protein (MASP), putative n=2 Tax=Trypanosoma cruzi TaxID=5693 RepID=Q4D1C2_TRYCC|nr:mucin-associated surface protein (MASP), putative [Trypanosoma cruzi]EAN86324.1 mucin-associated surface protein (MASP), putative [Trypanosoma cruzi]PWV20745.1 Mucin-associated surface protein (MASP) [Trypanosoma cruzi]|eukprot:XP_808175.1 mucin-associated surface protein (MASP) [Trypanosoma cruzi strain CL Brener]
MAMMMTGRVLLVCALCVLWCGAAVEAEGDGSGGSAELLPESQEPEKSPEGTQDFGHEAGGLKEELTPTSADEDDEDDDDYEGAEAEEEKQIEGQSGEKGNAAPDPVSGEKKLIGTEQQTRQSIVSAEDTPLSGNRESNAILTQTKIEGTKDSDKNPPAVENPLTTVNREQTLHAEGNLPPLPEVDDSREHDGKDTTSEDKKNVQPPETAATPTSHRDKGSEGTGDDTNATTVTANTTDTTNTQNSDSSTAVSHTTSPLLLLLLLVACAAAAAVVAA